MAERADDWSDARMARQIERLAVARLRNFAGRELLERLAAVGWSVSVSGGPGGGAMVLQHPARVEASAGAPRLAKRIQVVATPGGFPLRVFADLVDPVTFEVRQSREWTLGLSFADRLHAHLEAALRHLGELRVGGGGAAAGL